MAILPMYIVHFSMAFSPNIFNSPKLLNATLDEVKISNKLAMVSPISPLFKPKYKQKIWIIYELT